MFPTSETVPAVYSRGTRIGGGVTLVMGVLNVTPDSFSDGGLWVKPLEAIRRGVEMVTRGAAIVDVGGEPTNPRSTRISATLEWERIREVVRGLLREGVTVSVDTVNAGTAARALDCGVHVINDISGGKHDPKMVKTCADAGVAMVVQHWRGFPADPHLDQKYVDPVRDVRNELVAQVESAQQHGMLSSRIVVDPGLGFALEAEDGWAIVNSIHSFTQLGYPLLVGASRKRLIKHRYGENLIQGTLDVTAKCVSVGAWGVRVHDVEENVALIEQLSSK